MAIVLDMPIAEISRAAENYDEIVSNLDFYIFILTACIRFDRQRYKKRRGQTLLK